MNKLKYKPVETSTFKKNVKLAGKRGLNLHNTGTHADLFA
jgi:hypothetical protein